MHKQTIPIKIPIKTIAESRGKNKQSCTVFMWKHSLKEFQRASVFQCDTITRLWPADLRRCDGVWSQSLFLSASVIPSHYFQRVHSQSRKVRMNMNIVKVPQPFPSPASAVCIPCEGCWPCCSLTFPNMAACVNDTQQERSINVCVRVCLYNCLS